MLVAGSFTFLGLWALGVPLPGLLATIIGLMNFIPVLGPVIGGVPAVLLAMTEDPMLGLWVIGLIVLVQTVEGNFLTPMGSPHRRPAAGAAADRAGADGRAVRPARRGAGGAALGARDGAGKEGLWRAGRKGRTTACSKPRSGPRSGPPPAEVKR